MEFYCNTNFYGHRCYGVEAASLYYFGKHAEDLAPEEAAVLIGISNSPLPMTRFPIRTLTKTTMMS